MLLLSHRMGEIIGMNNLDKESRASLPILKRARLLAFISLGALLFLSLSACNSGVPEATGIKEPWQTEVVNNSLKYPDLSEMSYSELYEPDTSIAMAPTVAWNADNGAMSIADRDVRPQVVFVWLDKDLKVYDRDGGLITENLSDYVTATAKKAIPSFYISDQETAQELKLWLTRTGFKDCFVCSTPQNSELVKDVADLLNVRGMLDYSAVRTVSKDTLLDMIATTNDAHGKVILIGEDIASRGCIRKLQSLGSTVWAVSGSDTRSLVTLYARGINGVLVDDYKEAYRTEELFNDGEPTLLRVPFIIGHRGDPSNYVENTLDSAWGAYNEGADSVESDLHLSSDNEIFIYHDDYPWLFLSLSYEKNVEDYPIDILRSRVFVWEHQFRGITTVNAVPAAKSRNGVLFGQEEQKEYVVPLLSEYIDNFKNTSIIHNAEIKSTNPEIIGIYEDMLDSNDCRDQFNTITFNTVILDAMYSDHPELSAGALGYAEDSDNEKVPYYGDLTAIKEASGTEAAVAQLYGVLDKWNATMNPDYTSYYDEEIILAASRRGLTVWPWTYSEPEAFAADYLKSYTGLTTNYPWWASDLIVEIDSSDVTAASVEDIPKPTGITQNDQRKELYSAEAVPVDYMSDGQILMIWKYKARMIIDNHNYGYYYLYSEPFIYTPAN